MIDALAAIVKSLSTRSDIIALCGNRIAPKHKYSNKSVGDAWATPSKSIEIKYDPGGTPDIYIPVQDVRLQAACYGEDEYQASRVYGSLVNATRNSNRVTSTTSNGTALIYWITLDGTPESDFDESVSMPYIRVYLTARVSEIAV